MNTQTMYSVVVSRPATVSSPTSRSTSSYSRPSPGGRYNAYRAHAHQTGQIIVYFTAAVLAGHLSKGVVSVVFSEHCKNFKMDFNVVASGSVYCT